MTTLRPEAAHRERWGQPPRQTTGGPGWLAVALPSLPPLIAWLLTTAGAVSSPAAVLRSLGLLAGLCGYATFAVNLVLGARFRPVERLFGALDRMYRFHRRLSAAVGGLLVAHGVLLAASVLASDSATAAELLSWPVLAGIAALALLLGLVAVSVLARLRHEPFLRVHRLFGVVFGLAAVHVLAVPGVSAGVAWLHWYLVALTVLGAGAWFYRSGLGRTLVRRELYRVLRVDRIHPAVVELVLDPADDPIDFEPGQFAFVGIHDDEAITRELHPFSITSAPGASELRFVVKALGDFTSRLWGVQPGSWVRVEGPYGGFWHRGASHPRQIWIAGGIGVTPFLSMARGLEAGAPRIDLYYCTENAADTLFLDQLQAIAERVPELRVSSVRADEHGFLTAADVEQQTGDLRDVHVYLCGPLGMVHALSEQLMKAGVPASHLHAEEFRFRGRSG